MTTDEQKAFVRELAEHITAEMCKQIDSGKVPEDWDGHELRQWMQDKAKEANYSDRLKNHRAGRYQSYRNTVIINNL